MLKSVGEKYIWMGQKPGTPRPPRFHKHKGVAQNRCLGFGPHAHTHTHTHTHIYIYIYICTCVCVTPNSHGFSLKPRGGKIGHLEATEAKKATQSSVWPSASSGCAYPSRWALPGPPEAQQPDLGKETRGLVGQITHFRGLGQNSSQTCCLPPEMVFRKGMKSIIQEVVVGFLRID